jgi:hypothetical protein
MVQYVTYATYSNRVVFKWRKAGDFHSYVSIYMACFNVAVLKLIGKYTSLTVVLLNSYSSFVCV